MKKHWKLIIGGITVILLWRGSQIIFDVFYTTSDERYLGVRSGSRVHTITAEGYLEQHLGLLTNSKPSPYRVSSLGRFQDQCIYGEGKCIAFIGQDLLSAFRRINVIQYIAKEVDTSLPSDSTNRFALLSDIDPLWYYPYVLIQYIGTPSRELARLESQDPINYTQARDNTVALGERGIRYHCDNKKIKEIGQMNYHEFIQALDNKDARYRGVCDEGGELAHMLGFNYFYYLGDKKKSILYYKIAAFHENVPTITSLMPAIIEGSAGDHKTSAYLRYDSLQNTLAKISSGQKYNSDEEANLKASLEKATVKTMSEFSLEILTQASEAALSSGIAEDRAHNQEYLSSHGFVSQIIAKIFSSCDRQSIDCAILQLTMQQGFITKDGVVYAPHQDNQAMVFYRNKDKNSRSLKAEAL